MMSLLLNSSILSILRRFLSDPHGLTASWADQDQQIVLLEGFSGSGDSPNAQAVYFLAHAR